jgi:hypothetical protein
MWPKGESRIMSGTMVAGWDGHKPTKQVPRYVKKIINHEYGRAFDVYKGTHDSA